MMLWVIAIILLLFPITPEDDTDTVSSEPTEESSEYVDVPPSPEPEPTREQAPEPVKTEEPQPVPEPPVEPATVVLCPVTAYEDTQAVIDTGVLVLNEHVGVSWLDGHNTAGWDWIDTVEPGTLVEITCGPAEGLYEAYDNKWMSEAEGYDIPEWAYDDGLDLVMQTCTGLGDEPEGLGFTLLREV